MDRQRRLQMDRPDPPNAPDWVAEAIHNAKRQGMIPFILVIPVSPQAADATMKLDDRLAQIAGRDMRKALNKWREDRARA